MNNNAEECKHIENNEFDDELINKELVLELLKFSLIPLLYMTEDIQKDFEFYRRVDKNNGMAIAY